MTCNIRLEHTNHENVPAAVDYANKILPRAVVNIIESKAGAFIIWGFQDYRTYVWWCEKRKIEPLPSKDFFS